MNTTQLQRFLRGSFFIAPDSTGRMWISDRYMLVPVEDTVSALLADYNLPVEAMRCDVGRTVRRVDGEVPEFATLLAASPGDKVTRWQENGRDVLLDLGDNMAEVYRSATGKRYCLDRRRREVVDALTPAGEWRASVKLGLRPFVKVTEGAPCGLLMPLSTLLSDEATGVAA